MSLFQFPPPITATQRLPQPLGADRPLSVAWSISSEQQQDAYETYRGSFKDFYDVSDVAHGGKRGFTSRTTAWRFGASALGRGHSVAQTLTRGPSEVRRSGIDHISIILNLADVRGDCDGVDSSSAAGGIQFRDLSRPSRSHAERVDTINLVMPRASAPSWLLTRKVHGLVLAADSPGGRMVRSHLQALVDVAPHLSEDEGVAATEATFVIAERFLGNPGPVTPLHAEAIHRTIRQRAVQMFEARISDPGLDVGAVARAIGVSRSALYRAFGDMGGVQTYVVGRRLERAYAELRISGGAALEIEAAARRYGFLSAAAFTSAFRVRFGYPPGDVRPAGFAGRSVRPSVNARGELDGAVHDVLLDWLRAGNAA